MSAERTRLLQEGSVLDAKAASSNQRMSSRSVSTVDTVIMDEILRNRHSIAAPMSLAVNNVLRHEIRSGRLCHPH